jgi:hypothetical protein
VLDQFIDHFSERLKTRGYQYSNHYKAILEWWATDGSRFEKKIKEKKTNDSGHSYPLGKSFETEDFFQAALNRGFRALRDD